MILFVIPDFPDFEDKGPTQAFEGFVGDFAVCSAMLLPSLPPSGKLGRAP
jgi:hypothetical protein